MCDPQGLTKTMALRISKVSDDLYKVCASPPDVKEEWSPCEPVRGRRLTRELTDRGAHQIDVGEAMHEADPDWISKLRDPYIAPE